MQHHEFPQSEESRNACAREHAWLALRAHARVRAGSRCQICNTTGRLLFHYRTDERQTAELSDVLALCEECHALAESCKELKSLKKSLFLRIILEACLFLMIACIAIAFNSLSPLMLLSLFCASGFFAFLLEIIFAYTKPEP